LLDLRHQIEVFYPSGSRPVETLNSALPPFDGITTESGSTYGEYGKVLILQTSLLTTTPLYSSFSPGDAAIAWMQKKIVFPLSLSSILISTEVSVVLSKRFEGCYSLLYPYK
jgi:hypothetical protein